MVWYGMVWYGMVFGWDPQHPTMVGAKHIANPDVGAIVKP